MRLPLVVPIGACLAGLLSLPLLMDAQVPFRLGAAQAAALPDPSLDPGRRPGPLQTAVLAGGCFWGMEAIFEEVKGVSNVETGYAGGSEKTARYAEVSRGRSGHAEGVRITYDPAQVSYGELLKVFF